MLVASINPLIIKKYIIIIINGFDNSVMREDKEINKLVLTTDRNKINVLINPLVYVFRIWSSTSHVI
mgnify:CR=1 FL=1